MWSRKSIILLLLVLIGGNISGVVWFQDPPTGGWWWRQKTIKETSVYLNEHSQEGDTIFAANPLPVVLADRAIPAHMTSYHIHFAANENDKRSSFPSPAEYIKELEEHIPALVLVDGRMQRHYFSHFSFFEDFVNKNYEHTETFGTGHRRDWMEVWERKME